MRFSKVKFNPLLFATFSLFVVCFSCRQQPSAQLFTNLPSEKTGIDFVNNIDESEQMNIMTYEYFYNGGGVAIGDVNGDGLQDIYLTSNQHGNKLYLNKGGMHFEDITEQAGVGGKNSWATGVTMADVNGDGLLDIYVCYSGLGDTASRANLLYINDGVKNGVPHFTERAKEYGIDAPGTNSTQAVFFDYDHDGDLDMLLINHATMFYDPFVNTNKLRTKRHAYFSNRLYRNDNGNFVDVTETAGIPGGGNNFSLGVAVTDFNNDGWPDLYITNDYEEQDFMLINNHDGTFKDVTKQALNHISKNGMGCDVADYNNDGLMDIMVADMLPEDNKRQKLLKGPDDYDKYTLLVDSGYFHQNMRNTLQLGRGLSPDGTPMFSEIGQLAGVSNTDWSWSPLFADFDNDGWADLYITNGFLHDFTNMDFLKFTYTEKMQEARKENKELDKLKLIKDLPSTRISNYMFHNNHDLTFDNKTKSWGLEMPSVSNGAAYADLDNDGDLDLVVNNLNEKAWIIENHANEQLKNHYLKIKLRGSGKNTSAIGARVKVVTNTTQTKELYPVRGFQSSMEPILHFGLGNQSVAKKIEITWPGNKKTFLQNIKADTLLTIAEEDEKDVKQFVNTPEIAPIFTDYTAASGIDYQHKETTDVDFKTEYLLPHQVSKEGPFLAKADVNEDGLEDVFVGGNMYQPGVLYLQTKAGKFVKAPSQPWAKDAFAKDEGVLFFDANGDKHPDLFIVRGGAGFPPYDEAYQAVLYLNDGKGNFTLAKNALPKLTGNGSCIAAADYDKDGDMDLFIGGYNIPGSYPETSYSYLLRNDTKNGVVKFNYASDQPEKTLRMPGLVKTAVWADINNDGWLDLIVAGEFMPITVFENDRGKLVNKSENYGLGKSNGLWCKLVAADLNNDGKIDLVAGNMGLNAQWRASVSTPLTLCYDDFDGNGSIDPLLCYYVQGKSYPAASLDELAGQIPFVRKKFLRYEDYSTATLDDILSSEQKNESKTLTANATASCWFENDGKGHFIMHRLPLEAQVSAVNGIEVADLDGDGKKDLILSGNYYPWRVQWGRMDASIGVVCKGDGKGGFVALPYEKTGLLLNGDVRDMISISTGKNGKILVASRNNDRVAVRKYALKMIQK
jgi:hypothetical protein